MVLSVAPDRYRTQRLLWSAGFGVVREPCGEERVECRLPRTAGLEKGCERMRGAGSGVQSADGGKEGKEGEQERYSEEVPLIFFSSPMEWKG